MTGAISKKLIACTLPPSAANLLQSFYSLMDILVAGRTVGETGFAATSNASTLGLIISSMCVSITMDGTMLATQYKGVENEHDQIEIIGTLFTVAFIAVVLVTAAGLAAYRPLFRLLHVPAPVIEDAYGYMKIICYGAIFVFGYNAVCSIMKGLGDSKSLLYPVTVVIVVNFVLNLLLVGPFGMSTEGTTCTITLSQGISSVISVSHLKRKDSVSDFRLSHFSVKTDELAVILKVGFPTAIQIVSVNLSYLLIMEMLNQFGISVAITSGVGLKINTFTGIPCQAIGQAVTAMASRNMSVGNIKRMQKAASTGFCLNLPITLIMVLPVRIFGKQLILPFTLAGPEVLEEEILYLGICCSVNSLVYAVIYTSDFFAIGIGSANIVMLNALLDTGIVRLPVG